jgi:alcohol dehydrogenase (cytochrome c)
VTNSLYTSYIDNCREVTSGGGAGADKGGKGGGRGGWKVVQRPGGNPQELTGMAKIDLSTGEILRFDIGRAPAFGGVLATAGGLIFHGDMSRKFKAFDAKNGKELWSATVEGYPSVSTITYAVNGRQYVAVMTGDNAKTPELANEVPELKAPGHNELYVYALPAPNAKGK